MLNLPAKHTWSEKIFRDLLLIAVKRKHKKENFDGFVNAVERLILRRYPVDEGLSPIATEQTLSRPAESILLKVWFSKDPFKLGYKNCIKNT